MRSFQTQFMNEKIKTCFITWNRSPVESCFSGQLEGDTTWSTHVKPLFLARYRVRGPAELEDNQGYGWGLFITDLRGNKAQKVVRRRGCLVKLTSFLFINPDFALGSKHIFDVNFLLQECLANAILLLIQLSGIHS